METQLKQGKVLSDNQKTEESEKRLLLMMIFKIRFICLGSVGIEGKRTDGRQDDAVKNAYFCVFNNTILLKSRISHYKYCNSCKKTK